MTGSGRPDLEIIGSNSLSEPGHLVKVETKVKKNDLSPVQRYRMLKVCQAGGTAVAARLSKDERTIIWSTVDDQVFAETPINDCSGILECAEATCRDKRSRGDFEEYEIPLTPTGYE